jgi:hypothetical protein
MLNTIRRRTWRYCALVLTGALFFVPQALAQTNLATINNSTTITTGGTFQTVLPALGTGAVRRSITIQNNNTGTDNCWVFLGSGAATTAKSILLASGGSYQRYYPYVPSDAVQMTCTTTGDSVYIDTQ